MIKPTRPLKLCASSSAAAMTEIVFCGWLGQASAGDMLEYHRGHLALDILPQASRFSPAERMELARLAARAWWAAGQGLVHLMQRRHGGDDYAYLAVASARAERPGPLSALLATPLA